MSVLDCRQKLHTPEPSPPRLAPSSPSRATLLCLSDRRHEAAAHLVWAEEQPKCASDFECCHPAFNPCVATSFFPEQKGFYQ